MGIRAKQTHYRHKRKREPKNRFTAIMAKLWGAYKGQFRKNPKRTLIVTLVVVLIIALLIAHAFSRDEYISEDGYTHAEKFNGYVIADGIDVSYAQGEIDWEKIKKAGIDFVFIRAGFRDTGEGNLHEDENFQVNITGARRAHLAVGVYYFSQATTTKEAKEEANALLTLIEPYELDLPLVMDYELHGDGRLSTAISNGSLDSSGLYANALAFTNTVEKAGYDSAVYGNYDFLTHYIDGSSLSNTTNIWTAQYNSYAQFAGNYQFWQCSDQLQLSGTESEYVDRDFWYIPMDGVWKSNASDAKDRTSIGDCTIKLSKDTYNYIGFNVEPKVKVYDGRKRLRKGRDYTVCYVDNNHSGTGYAVVRGIGKYKDTTAVSFTVQ